MTIRLADGTTYRLWPVVWHGHRYVGLVMPLNLLITRFTAYSRHGELAYAIPFSAPPTGTTGPGTPRMLVVSWLRAGTPVPAVVSATVTDQGPAPWSVTVQVGPWGTCLQLQIGFQGTWCRPTLSYPPNAVTLVTSGPYLTEVAGITGRAVAYIQLRLHNGKTAQVHVLHIGGQGSYSVSIVTPVTSWTAYTTTGHPNRPAPAVPASRRHRGRSPWCSSAGSSVTPCTRRRCSNRTGARPMRCGSVR